MSPRLGLWLRNLGCLGLLGLLALPWMVWLAQPEWNSGVVLVDPAGRPHAGLSWLLRHWKCREGAQVRTTLREVPNDCRVLVLAATTAPSGPPSLADEDLERLEQLVARGGTLIVEANSLAACTPSARARLETLLGVTWTGWGGRYCDQTGQLAQVTSPPPPVELPVFALAHQDRPVIILGVPKPVQSLSINRPGFYRGVAYCHWFDLVVARPGTEVLADFEWKASGEAVSAFNSAGLKQNPPAVTRCGNCYYLAGEFSRILDDPGPPELSGWEQLNRWRWAFSPRRDQRYFWCFYVPLMEQLVGR